MFDQTIHGKHSSNTKLHNYLIIMWLMNFLSILWVSVNFSAVLAAPYSYTPCNLCLNQASSKQLANITLRLYTNKTLDYYTSVLIGDAVELVDEIDAGKPTVLYISGWSETPKSLSVATVVGGYLKRQDHNVILVDYEEIAARNYLFAVSSVDGVGYTVAKGLDDMKAAGFNLSSLHVVAHSLGAQVAGKVGKYASSTLWRITGLDPAGPGFDIVGENLSETDAEFVDVIHTDAGNYGSSMSKGDANFFPNGGTRLQPGCPEFRKPFSDEDFCDHHRSWYYYAESLSIEDNFIAIECNSYRNFKNFNCANHSTVIMGLKTPSNASGNFYLQTNSASPFGRGGDGDGVNYKNPGFSLSTFLSIFNPLTPN